MLEECIQLLDGGASLDECLQRYPDDAEELRPYLELRADLLSEPLAEPPAGAYGAGRSRLLEQLAMSREARATTASPWSLVAGVFTDHRLPGGALFRAAAGVAAVLALGIGALGASAAGGFEPARNALEPARDLLRTLHIVPDDAEPRERESEQRPSDVDSDAVPTSEETREADRATATQVPCDRGSDRPCEDEPRPSPTPVRDVRPTDEPIRDAAPTSTPLRNEPSRPSDREPTDTPAQDAPRDAEPTLENDTTDAPPRDAPQDDTRSGNAAPTDEPQPENAAPVHDEPDKRPVDSLGSSAGDGREAAVASNVYRSNAEESPGWAAPH